MYNVSLVSKPPAGTVCTFDTFGTVGTFGYSFSLLQWYIQVANVVSKPVLNIGFV